MIPGTEDVPISTDAPLTRLRLATLVAHRRELIPRDREATRH